MFIVNHTCHLVLQKCKIHSIKKVRKKINKVGPFCLKILGFEISEKWLVEVQFLLIAHNDLDK